MAYFHAIAVLEAAGRSLEQADQAASALLKAIRSQRLRYYQHETTGGLDGGGARRYYSVFADFDIDAYNEEKAADAVEEVLDAVSTDEVHYLAHGLAQGEQRVRSTRAGAAADQDQKVDEVERRTEESDSGRRPRSRPRGRQRREERGPKAGEADVPAATRPAIRRPAVTRPVVEPEEPPAVAIRATPEPIMPEDETELLSESELIEEPWQPPARSSASMRLTVAVSVRASELAPGSGGLTPASQEQLLALAIAEAHRRHPEVPADLPPRSEVQDLPRGDTVWTLTWEYDAPLPSAASDPE